MCTCVCIVIKGHFDIVSYSFKGREIVYNSLFKGDIFGNNLLFSSDPIYRGNVVAKSDSEVVLIEQPTLVYLFKNNNDFMMEYLMEQADFVKRLNARIKLLSFDHAEERLKYLFIMNNGEIKFKYITTLAETLNLTREVTSRMINKLVKEGKIKRSKNLLQLV